MKQYYVYIMANSSRSLYTGITNDLEQRVYQHKSKLAGSFTKRYNITKLVYWEAAYDVHAAIAREKQIKGWLRRKKIALIEGMNPQWIDLSEGWFGDSTLSPERSEGGNDLQPPSVILNGTKWNEESQILRGV